MRISLLILLVVLASGTVLAQGELYAPENPSPQSIVTVYKAFYMMSPDSSVWQLIVKDNGSLQTTKIAVHPDSVTITPDSMLVGGKFKKNKK